HWLLANNATGGWVVNVLTGEALHAPHPFGVTRVWNATAVTANGTLLAVFTLADSGNGPFGDHLRPFMDEVSFDRMNATVGSADTDGEHVVWHLDPRPGGPRRAYISASDVRVRVELAAPPGQAWSPVVSNERVALTQNDGLVRLLDLASGASRVLPARDQENVEVRLRGDAAVWLSGTLEGHNVLLVPLG
ncbi:MAG: hypothetical protein LC624_09640, partial [Halobacteriales archaeon]|nr:hypothetical protein [Halobacteriales archaeon]